MSSRSESLKVRHLAQDLLTVTFKLSLESTRILARFWLRLIKFCARKLSLYCLLKLLFLLSLTLLRAFLILIIILLSITILLPIPWTSHHLLLIIYKRGLLLLQSLFLQL